MRKALLLIGKGLITFSFLWPLPFGFILYPLFGYKIDMPMWGIESGYWWPLIGFMVMGFLLCWIANYKAANKKPLENTQSPFSFMMGCILVALAGIAAIFLMELVIIGLYYTFFTKYITIIVPIGAAVGIIGFLLVVGWKCYKNNRNV